MASLARWCVRHRALVVVLWLALLGGSVLAASAVGPAYTADVDLPHSDSQQALALLRQAAPSVSGDIEVVVYATTTVGSHLRDPAVEARVQRSLAALTALPHVTRVSSPYAPHAQQRNLDDTIGFATVYLDVRAQQLDGGAGRRLVTTARSASGPGVQVAVSGLVAEELAGGTYGDVWIGGALAAVLLLLVFGSFVAAALPLVVAAVSLGTAVSLDALLTHVVATPQFSSQLVLLIGLGVGIDYALFLVSRFRQALTAGADVDRAAETAVRTSGRAVLFAGSIVALGLLAMVALRIRFLDGVAVDAALGVLATMAAAVTLTPALLATFGPRVATRRSSRAERGWWRWAELLRRHPVPPALAALAVITVLALPLGSLRLGESDYGNDPTSSTTRQAYDLLARGFGPGFDGPLELVAQLRSPAQAAALTRVSAAIEAQHDVAHVGRPTLVTSEADDIAGSGTVALVPVYPTFGPQDPRTAALVESLRRTVIPGAAGSSGLVVDVGGVTASFVDLSHELARTLPLFVLTVALLATALLALTFRSVLVPVTALVVNLLSSAAAFGVLVAVFTWGWLDRLVDVDRTGPVEPFVPAVLFAVLFGLSMDYEVFLVSRVQEEWKRSGDTATAVRDGLVATGRVITAAALIMVAVFGAFTLSDERVVKELGLGLAVGIAIDALVVRSVLIPAIMLLAGRANWWWPTRPTRARVRCASTGLARSPQNPTDGGSGT